MSNQSKKVTSQSNKDGLYILLISVHGLIRGEEMELGRDADTGGQIKYAVELAKALGQHKQIKRVDLITRLVKDKSVSEDYAQPLEQIGDKAFIVRIKAGPDKYIRKEMLWPYLNIFADNTIQHIRRVGMSPDIVHSHYADAGYVGYRIAGLLDVPLFHTGHSLGRVKKARLLDKGLKPSNIERQYNIAQRIEAEELAMDASARVIASTSQEIREQYSVYDNYQPERMIVIPPGVDLSLYYPPRSRLSVSDTQREIERFLSDPTKPMILAVSRADERKNIRTLIKAYGESPELQEAANLLIIAGSREDIRSCERGAKKVLEEMLYLIDYYDLYGRIAYPKGDKAIDVPLLYRLAKQRKGVFINPALTEPFGLTLLEAAATGLPIVATEDGGPQDILRLCQNGFLIDPLDSKKMASALLDILASQSRWHRFSQNGINGVHKHFSWNAHVEKYLKEVKKIVPPKSRSIQRFPYTSRNRLPSAERILITDIDNTLLGSPAALKKLLDYLKKQTREFAFGVATGRHIESALEILKKNKVPTPDVLITSVGTEIHYGPRIKQDLDWKRHINHRWNREKILEIMETIPNLELQKEENQREHKISYLVPEKVKLNVKEIRTKLRKNDLHVQLVYSHNEFLDILPMRASKGLATRYFAMKWDVRFEHMLVSGDSGNDESMLRGNPLGVVVGNYSQELEKLRGLPRIYFAQKKYSEGIIEGIEYFNFFGDEIKVNEN